MRLQKRLQIRTPRNSTTRTFPEPVTSLLAPPQIAIQPAPRDPHDVADVGDGARALIVELVEQLPLLGTELRRVAAMAAPQTSCGQPRMGAFADEVALKLGQCAEDLEDEPSPGRSRVNGLLQALEADASGHQVLHGGDQMGEGASQPIQAPDNECVARAQEVQGSKEPRPLSLCAGNLVLEDPYAAGRLQGVPLKVEILIKRADAGVAHEVAGGGC